MKGCNKKTEAFWKKFPGEPRLHNMAEKLRAVLELSEAGEYWIKAKKRNKLRAKFDKKKYSKPLGRCFICAGKADCFHHLIPISRGGSYHWGNVVPLCNGCHASIHPWLKDLEMEEEPYYV